MDNEIVKAGAQTTAMLSAGFASIRKMADEIDIRISGLCSFLFWPYPLTSNVESERTKGLELAAKMTHAAHELGTENLLVVPGRCIFPGERIMPRLQTMFA